MDQLPFYDEEIPIGKVYTEITTLVNSQPLENTPFIAPYVPINHLVCLKAIQVANLNPQDVLVDLGCGDGRILQQAMETLSKPSKAIGVEYDPLLIAHIRKEYPWMEVIHADMFTIDLSALGATVLILYLLPAGLSKLRPLLAEWLSQDSLFRVVTVGYAIPEWDPVLIAFEESSGSFMGGSKQSTQAIHLYNYTSVMRMGLPKQVANISLGFNIVK